MNNPRNYDSLKTPRSILITGASSGLGAALALAYARPDTFLFLSGRDAVRLAQTVKDCRDCGATVESIALDVTNEMGMLAWVEKCHVTQPLDLVIANAGIGESGKNWEDRAAQQFSINVQGVFNTIHPALRLMEQQGHGQIAIMSSMAGFYGMRGAPAYCAAKAALRVYAEGLRAHYADQNIAVNVICPGFVRSRITDQNNFAMPFFMEAEQAARIILKSLATNKGRISFPWQMRLITWILRCLPSAVADRISFASPKNPKN